MKTSNTRVRLKDIKQGMTIYVAHPVYGISEYFVMSKPYMNKDIGLFFDCYTCYNGKTYTEWDNKPVLGNHSISDCGIDDLSLYKDSYNGRRAFFKRKHAEEWMTKWSKEPNFIEQHKRHEETVKNWDEMSSWYDDEDYYHYDYAYDDQQD